MTIFINPPVTSDTTNESWNGAYPGIVDLFFSDLCKDIAFNQRTGFLEFVGEEPPEMPPEEGSDFCECIAWLATAGKTVTIALVDAGHTLPNGKTVSESGGAAITSGPDGVKQPNGNAGTGSDSTIFVDISNNHGEGYEIGSIGLKIRTLLASGSAFRFALGIAERSGKTRYEHSRDRENEIYRPPLGFLPRDEDSEGEPEETEQICDPYWVPPDDGGSDPGDTPAPVFGEEIENPELPLVFVVPGIGGSALEDADGSRTWSESWVVGGAPELMSTNLDALYPGKPIKSVFENRGSLEANGGYFETFYEPVVTHLETKGYERGKNLWVFSYNWTQSNADSGLGFFGFVERKKALFKEKFGFTPTGVDVIAHSMGGHVTRVALKLGQKFDRVAFVGSPHIGATDSYCFVHPDIDVSLTDYGGFMDNLSLFGVTDALWGLIFSEDYYSNKVKHLLSRLDSVYELCPDHDFIESFRHYILSVEGEATPRKTVESTYFEGDTKLPDSAISMLRRALSFKKKIRSYPNTTKYLQVFNDKLETPVRVESDTSPLGRSYEVIHEPADGDETVPSISADRPIPNAERFGGASETHSELFSDQAVLDELTRFLQLN